MNNARIQLYTGDGKGKTTAAAGLALRALGAGMRVYFAQFLKHGPSGEICMLERFAPQFCSYQYGLESFVRGKPTELEREAGARGVDECTAALCGGAWDLVVLDEINTACQLGVVSVADVVGALRQRAQGVEVVLTGRGAPQELMDLAELITEMRSVRHYYDTGTAARPGIES